MADDENPLVKNRSMLRDFLASIATMSGDLSNITAPPFVLDTKSVIEIPSFWAENPTIFVSPAKSEDPVQRALLVLRSFLSGMRSQSYMGHNPEAGVKKPLNAFLGELFVGRWEDENGVTHLISEQVSHHPPITACRVWNDKHGVITEGYNRQTITFNGSVNVQCSGHILKTITKYDEQYLMPIPGFKVKGILGTPYPELSGTYYIPSTNGYTSVIHFSGTSFFSSSSKKHSFTAHLFKQEDGESKPLYTLEGHWDSGFTIKDEQNGETIETFNIDENVLEAAPGLIIDPIEEQDPWESRNAWNDTVTALNDGDMKGVTEAKGRLEQGQRDMREDEEKRGTKWETLFFKRTDDEKAVAQLYTKIPNEDFQEVNAETEGVWKFDLEAWKSVKKPYHGSLRPDNTSTGENGVQSEDSNPVPNKRSENEDHTEPQQLQQLPDRTKSRQTERDTDAVENGRLAETNNGTSVDMIEEPEVKLVKGITKEQPAPQPAQVNTQNQHRGSGVEGITVNEKDQIEDMLRDQSSNAAQTRRESKTKRRSVNESS